MGMLRWVWTALATVATAGVGGYLYYANYSPDRAAFPVRGVDVSHHQGTIDWPVVARSDVSFAFIKATEGGDYLDDTFARNFAEARAAGLAVGAYHFFTLCRPGAEQATNFLKAVPRGQPMLPPVIDLEFTGSCPARPSIEQVRVELDTFFSAVEKALGRPMMIYAGSDFEQMYGLALPKRERWVRSIAWPIATEPWLIWQYHNAGRVDGIDTEVDLNVLHGGRSELLDLLGA